MVKDRYIKKILLLTIKRLDEKLIFFSKLKVKSSILKLTCLFEKIRIKNTKKYKPPSH